MRFKRLVREWDEMAKVPLPAILHLKREWDETEFFATGEAYAAEFFSDSDALGYPKRHERALDFGCGVGRVTRYLARRFSECWGVDVSERMLRAAERYAPGCRFQLHRHADLRDFPEDHFDLVYSMIVLQHQPNRHAIESYIREFVRVLRPQGLLAFQLPTRLPSGKRFASRLRSWFASRQRAYSLLRALGVGSGAAQALVGLEAPPVTMTVVPQERVLRVLASSGARLLRAAPHHASGAIPSVMYYCTK